MDKEQDYGRIVVTRHIEEILNRAKIYVKAGLPVHFTGPAGAGKTTLAVKLAKDLGRPYYMVQGDESFTRQELIGGPFGFYQKVVEDNFIPTVSKVERKMAPAWVDNPIALACREGGTLIYDEFTRARPETNNLLLGIISEKVLLTVGPTGKLTPEEVHPRFSLILTSNPVEYVGVNKAQDALSDRLVTIRLTGYDEETETAITAHQAQITQPQALRLVRFVHRVNKKIKLNHSTTRASVMLGKVVRARFMDGFDDEHLFYQCCLDVLGLEPASLETLAELWNKGGAVKSRNKEAG